MPKHEKVRESENNSIRISPARKRRAYKPLFEAEKNAKNKAYSFILTSNLLEDFAHYSRLTAGMDHHVICVSAIVNKHFANLLKHTEQ